MRGLVGGIEAVALPAADPEQADLPVGFSSVGKRPALRLEVLPDERLPKRGPGRVYYEGPAGDFFLSEVTLAAGTAPVRLAKASQTYAAGGSSATSSQ